MLMRGLGVRVCRGRKAGAVGLLLRAPLSQQTQKPERGTGSWRASLAPFYHLSKPRLSALVIVTTMFSYGLAPGAFEVAAFAGSAIGTSLCVASAQTWNQLIEVERDRRMLRTENRPLPVGQLSTREAAAFGVGTAALGAAVLLATCPPLSCLLATSNIALYGAGLL